jgi:hypothetical protein
MEIEHFFSLSEDELAAVRRRRTVLNRLALALQFDRNTHPSDRLPQNDRRHAQFGRDHPAWDRNHRPCPKLKIQCCWGRLTICSKLHAKRDQCIVARVRRFGAKVAGSFVSNAIAPGVRCHAGVAISRITTVTQRTSTATFPG